MTESKVDPAALVLRGSPSPVRRYRRALLIGIAASGAAAIFGLT